MVLAPEHEMVAQLTTDEQAGAVESYVAEVVKKSAVDRLASVGQKTGVFTGSYAVNPINGEKMPIWVGEYVLAEYGTGAIMCVPAHDERDFAFAKEFGLPIRRVIAPDASQAEAPVEEAYVEAGVMVNCGELSGTASEAGKDAVTDRLIEMGKGLRQVNYRLRDWVFSRQRYWGEPIPIIYCEACGEVPLPEEELPLTLPDVENYEPTGTGESPLATMTEWVNTTCPKCGGPARRETDTMPQWAGSSWYFLRYPDAHNAREPWGRKIVDEWLPVNLYVGGIEHAILHLLYARFFTKFLYDIGTVGFDEPFEKLFNQGMIYKDGAKMSKSKGNVVNPDEIIERFGVDTLRLYLLFMGPPDKDLEWSEQGVAGADRFLHRLWETVVERQDRIDATQPYEGTRETLSGDYQELFRKTHTTIRKVTEDMEGAFHFNTAISQVMELVNLIRDERFSGASSEVELGVLCKAIESAVMLLSPVIPHIAEEMWRMLGHKQTVFKGPWPTYDEKATEVEKVEIAVQVNGKVRTRMMVPADASREDIERMAEQNEIVHKYTSDKKVVKTVVVPGKLVNLVVR